MKRKLYRVLQLTDFSNLPYRKRSLIFFAVERGKRPRERLQRFDDPPYNSSKCSGWELQKKSVKKSKIQSSIFQN